MGLHTTGGLVDIARPALRAYSSRLRLVGVLVFFVAVCVVPGVLAASAGAAVRFGGSHGVPACAEVGCLYGSVGVAVDPVNGDVYVPEVENERVSVFSPSGEFLFAFGYGVRDGSNTLETCTAATNCLRGLAGSGVGEFSAPQAVTVDSEGNVYVANFANSRVEKFKAEEVPGHETVVKFVVAFEEGFIDQLAYGSGDIVTVGGPHDDVYVGDQGRVDVFERSGTFVEQVSFAGLLTGGQVGALAVDSAGDMFVQVGTRDTGGALGMGAVRGVRELEPNGTEKAVFDSSGFAGALAMSAADDLYVADAEGGLKILAYHTSTDSLFESFEPQVGAETTTQGAYGMAFSSGVTPEPELYMMGSDEREWVGWIEAVPPAGPWVKPRSESGSPEPRGSATLRASIDPEGDATACRFEYDTREYTVGEPSHGTSVPCEPSSSLGEGFANVAVAARLKGLTPSVTYHWRVVASNSASTVECSGARGCAPDQSFQETAAALVDGPWASEVSAVTATLSARIDPLGVDTTYRLEYGRTTAYEEPPSVGDIGSGEVYVPVSVSLAGLQSHTLYHYRLVTSSTFGSSESDRTFTTQSTAAGVLLPDERSWEQVSPPDKHGAQIFPEGGARDLLQAASDGHAVEYEADAPVTGTPHTNSDVTTIISSRTGTGWSAVEPMPTKSIPESPEQADELTSLEFPPFGSIDLSHALVEVSPHVRGLSAEANERDLYVWNAATDDYVPVVTATNDETGEPYGGKAASNWMEFRGGTPDLSHVVFTSPFALTAGALTPSDLKLCEEHEPCADEKNLYEWSAGRLQLVNVLPDGKPTVAALLGRGELIGPYVVHAVSNDGRWIVWTHQNRESSLRPVLYVRDMVGKETFQVGGKEAVYETMSGDGSRVFYLEDGDLYEFDTATHSATDITIHGPGEAGAGVKDAILGSSEDGRYVYIVATGELTGSQQNGQGATAQSGGLNLYMLHDTGSGWDLVYIATLSADDEHDWYASSGSVDPFLNLREVTSHVSTDGRWLTFMSDRSLTGYDNRDVLSGEADEEVFLYSADTGRLVCASCSPTGERPHGILFEENGKGKTSKVLADPEGAWLGHWVAGSMPGWHPFRNSLPMYEPRVLHDSGRLFFQSADALVPQDTNDEEDVYEYEPPGVGTCTEENPSYSATSGGCISLISSGTSAQESIFYDSSESGDDVFFETASKLAWTDIDEAPDVYDARVDGGFPEPVKPPACEGDACQGTQTSPIDETPSSLTFNGLGNMPVTGTVTSHVCRKGFVRRKDRCVRVAKRRKRKGMRQLKRKRVSHRKPQRK